MYVWEAPNQRVGGANESNHAITWAAAGGAVAAGRLSATTSAATLYLVSAALRHRLPPRLHDNHHRADRDDRAHGEDTNEGQPVEVGSAEGQTPTERSAEAERFERASQYILRRSTSIRGRC